MQFANGVKKMWWMAIPVVAFVFLALLVARALAFLPRGAASPAPGGEPAGREGAAERLAEMLRCATVSRRHREGADDAAFERFRSLLAELYPRVHGACAPERVGPTGLLYRIPGRSAGMPSVFMAHYDVVPAGEGAWEKPPFAGIIENGVLWGRGALDTKVTLCAAMEAAENLLALGFAPLRDVYLAFSGDEELAGPTAPAMVDLFESRGIRLGLVLDEGGAVVSDIFPGVRAPGALIGVAEKGMLDVELAVETQGGHASAPPKRTPIGTLSRAVAAIEASPFPSRLTRPVADMFGTLGRHAPFAYRLLFANLWCFLPLVKAMARGKGGELNAMLRTTCAFTMMEGSQATNVLPPKARMVANLRLLNHTPEQALERLRRVAGNPAISFRALHGMGPSKVSDTSGEAWQRLKEAVEETWPGAVVSPYIMFACSDSRHYCRISDHVFRFSAMALTKEERAMIHGNNERIPLEKVETAVRFYTSLLRRC